MNKRLRHRRQRENRDGKRFGCRRPILGSCVSRKARSWNAGVRKIHADAILPKHGVRLNYMNVRLDIVTEGKKPTRRDMRKTLAGVSENRSLPVRPVGAKKPTYGNAAISMSRFHRIILPLGGRRLNKVGSDTRVVRNDVCGHVARGI